MEQGCSANPSKSYLPTRGRCIDEEDESGEIENCPLWATSYVTRAISILQRIFAFLFVINIRDRFERDYQWNGVSFILHVYSYNYNIRDEVYLRNGVTEPGIYLRGSERRMLKNPRTRGNKRFPLLLSFLFLSRSWCASPTFIPGLPPPFPPPLFHGRKNYLRVSIDEIERDSLRRFSSPGQFVVYREKSWMVSRAISSAVHNRDWLRRLRYNHCHLSSSAT